MALVVRRTMVVVTALALGGCVMWSTSDVQVPSVTPLMAAPALSLFMRL